MFYVKNPYVLSWFYVYPKNIEIRSKSDFRKYLQSLEYKHPEIEEFSTKGKRVIILVDFWELCPGINDLKEDKTYLVKFLCGERELFYFFSDENDNLVEEMSHSSCVKVTKQVAKIFDL